MSHRRDININCDLNEFITGDNTNAIFEVLSRQIGNVVTVFTHSGGESGEGFTGLLVEVNRNLALLITDPPSFGHVCRSGRSRFITAHTVIPLNKIVCITYPQI